MNAVDFHTHLLPCMDDGSSSVTQSLKLLKKEGEQGISTVFLTPHFYPHRESPKEFLSRRDRAWSDLQKAAEGIAGLPQFKQGAEVYFFEGISDCEFLPALALEGTRCVLVEMPMGKWSVRALSELTEIRQKQGLTPILAHLDRYLRPFHGKELFRKAAELPVLIQVNASFFQGRHRPLAVWAAKNKLFHLLGSDCHNETDRPPNLPVAFKQLDSAFLAELRRSEECILNGQIFL